MPKIIDYITKKELLEICPNIGNRIESLKLFKLTTGGSRSLFYSKLNEFKLIKIAKPSKEDILDICKRHKKSSARIAAFANKFNLSSGTFYKLKKKYGIN